MRALWDKLTNDKVVTHVFIFSFGSLWIFVIYIIGFQCNIQIKQINLFVSVIIYLLLFLEQY